MRKFINIALIVAGSVCAVIGLLGFMGILSDKAVETDPDPEPEKPGAAAPGEKSAG